MTELKRIVAQFKVDGFDYLELVKDLEKYIEQNESLPTFGELSNKASKVEGQINGLINSLKNGREQNENGEVKRLVSIALTDLEKAKWAIKEAWTNNMKDWVNPPIQRFS